jgi:hypothetical protein
MRSLLRIVLLTAAFLAGLNASALAPGTITLIPNGAVEVRPGSAASWQTVEGQTVVSVGQEVRTRRSSTAQLVFSDGSRIQLFNDSYFTIDKMATDETRFSLVLGKIRAAFAGFLSSRVSIKTPLAVCGVRGTVFEVGSDEKGTEVTVSEGILEVKDTQGKQSVITSEETMHVGERGLERPHALGLNDKRALPAVRPYAVRQEMARDTARRTLENNRNRELKAAQAQLGKDLVNAYGQRVRLEEYLILPDVDSFEVLFLNYAKNSFNWGHLLENFNSALPTDLSQVPAIISGAVLSPTQPSNWLKSFEFYATNTVDADKEDIVFGAPTQVNFAGFNNGNQLLLWYPSTIAFTQTLSGPGVPGGSRIQFQQFQDYNISNAGDFTWVQQVQATPGKDNLQTILTVALNPASTDLSDPASVPNGGAILSGGPCTSGNCTAAQLLYNETAANTFTSLPNGPNKADLLDNTIYPDGSSVSVEKYLVSNSGQLLDFADASSGLFNQYVDYNLELNIQSNLFQGRAIDVLIAPEILNQKQQDAPGPVGFQP